MEDIFGVIWIVFIIITIVARFVGKDDKNKKNSNNNSDIGEKITNFLNNLDTSQNRSSSGRTTDSQTNKSSVSSPGSAAKNTFSYDAQIEDEEWVPAYEESQSLETIPGQSLAGSNQSIMQQAQNIQPGLQRDNLHKEQLEKSRMDSNSSILDNEITVRDGIAVGGGIRNNSGMGKSSDRKYRYGDAYHTKIKKSKPLLDEESFTRDELVRGIIFKEILGEPRSIRPYRPTYRNK